MKIKDRYIHWNKKEERMRPPKLREAKCCLNCDHKKYSLAGVKVYCQKYQANTNAHDVCDAHKESK
jgi:hypothetical protein